MTGYRCHGNLAISCHTSMLHWAEQKSRLIWRFIFWQKYHGMSMKAPKSDFVTAPKHHFSGDLSIQKLFRAIKLPKSSPWPTDYQWKCGCTMLVKRNATLVHAFFVNSLEEVDQL